MKKGRHKGWIFCTKAKWMTRPWKRWIKHAKMTSLREGHYPLTWFSFPKSMTSNSICSCLSFCVFWPSTCFLICWISLISSSFSVSNSRALSDPVLRASSLFCEMYKIFLDFQKSIYEKLFLRKHVKNRTQIKLKELIFHDLKISRKQSSVSCGLISENIKSTCT